MIRRDHEENDSRKPGAGRELVLTLECDHCAREFDGSGLSTAHLVRAAARDLEGYRRRRFLKGEELEYCWLDLCAPCQEEANLKVIEWAMLFGHALCKTFAKGNDSPQK